jgi:hypothetical protein
MAVPLTYRQRWSRKGPRLVKFGRRWVQAALNGGRPDTRLAFVVGSQRSGTRLPLQVLDSAPEVMTYSEGAAPFFRRVLLEPLDRVEALRRASVFPVIALKPICETHRVHELLDRFPRSRAVWIFRNYQDAVNSASVKWKSGPEAVRRLASAHPESAGWRAGGLTPARLEMVRDLYSERMTRHEANAVMWYLRNALFFDLSAQARPEVLLVQYEDLVTRPDIAFSRMFGFLEVQLPSGFERRIREPHGATRPFPDISQTIRSLCDDLHARLVEYHSSTAAAGHDFGAPSPAGSFGESPRPPAQSPSERS